MAIPGGITGLTPALLISFLVGRMRAGATGEQIGHYVRAVRELPPGIGPTALSPTDLAAIERHVAGTMDSGTSVLVVASDTVMRVGLAGVLRAADILVWHDTPEAASPAIGGSWDYVLVWLPSPSGIDPHSTIDWIATISSSDTTVLAVYPGTITDLVRLRLAESGARYAVPQEWLAERVSDLPAMLSTASLPERFYLETPLALRQKAGLQLSGKLAPLLDLARDCSPRLWTDSAARTEDWLSRAEVRRFRRVALEDAGVPPPPYSRYASSVRQAPRMPEWRDVRRVVRLAFNVDE